MLHRPRGFSSIYSTLCDADISKLTGIRRTGAGSIAAYLRLLSNDPCAYCGQPSRGSHHIDHIHAHAEGGADHWTNYTAACEPCNMSKLNLSLCEFLLAPEYLAAS